MQLANALGVGLEEANRLLAEYNRTHPRPFMAKRQALSGLGRHRHHRGGGGWRGGGWWGGPGYWGPELYVDYPQVVTVPVIAIETPDVPVVEVVEEIEVEEPQEDSSLLGLLGCCCI